MITQLQMQRLSEDPTRAGTISNDFAELFNSSKLGRTPRKPLESMIEEIGVLFTG